MNTNELTGLLKKILLLVVLTFAAFILTLQASKYAQFIVEINKTINTALKSNNESLEVITNQFNSYEDYMYLNYNPDRAHTPSELKYQDDLKTLKHSDWAQGINILLTGSDKNDFHVKKSRADVIIILRITPAGKILSISIPRDTLITVYGKNNKTYEDKIGHSMYWNGLDGLKKSCEDLLGSPIYKVVIIDNFRSFEAFLSIIGGVSIDKKLEGKLGIQWIRNRSFKFGDIDRCQRHQLFMEKAIGKLWKMTAGGNVFISTFLFNNLRKIVQTDLSEDDFIKLLYILKTGGFDPENDYYSSVLPGRFDTFYSELMKRDNLSCWRLDETIPQFLSLLFYSDNSSSSMLNDLTVSYLDFIKFDLKKMLINANVRMSGKKYNPDSARVVELVDTLVSGTSER